ncbi:MAG: hypothetical protein OES47_06645 [Acidobacteriota bacterium]|nr:hypothetical protein [Acidobacteriota bacterium]
MSKKKAAPPPEEPSTNALAALGNLLMLVPLIVAWWFNSMDSGLYYASVQEDNPLEWMTFWAFFIAAVLFALAAVHQRRSAGAIPWFLAGVSLFCCFVAMEEISWAQRIFGYRPPEYFLAENFQQELNIHNVWSTDFRKLGVKVVILGYGVVLALVSFVPKVKKLLERARIVAPPWFLIPGFGVTFWVYETYPWSHSGEIVELMLGTGFFLAALAAFGLFNQQAWDGGLGLRSSLLCAVVVMVLGFSSVGLSRLQVRDDPETLAAARAELVALAADLGPGGRPITKCGRHKRLFSYVEKYNTDGLYSGRFAAMVDQGLPETRADFFIDLWNSAIWIRHKCDSDSGREVVFVYSFGPNRRRDSTSWEINDDDIGVMIYEHGG